MFKKFLVIFTVLFAMVLVSGCGEKKEVQLQNSEKEKEVFQKEEIENPKKLEEEIVDLGDGWEIYRNYKFGFEVTHPVDWKLEIEDSDPNKASLNDSFYFKKEQRVYFAVLVNGGFGQGIQTPRVTNQLFKERDSKMFWYEKDVIPSIVYLNDYEDLNEWGEENRIEMSGISKNSEILEKIYKEFKFIQ